MTDTTSNVVDFPTAKAPAPAVKAKRKSLAEKKTAKREAQIFHGAIADLQGQIYGAIQEAARVAEDKGDGEHAYRAAMLNLYAVLVNQARQAAATYAGFGTFDEMVMAREAVEQAEHDREEAAKQAELVAAVLAYQAGVPGFECYVPTTDNILYMVRPNGQDHLWMGQPEEGGCVLGGGPGAPIKVTRWRSYVHGYVIEIVDGKAVFRKLAA